VLKSKANPLDLVAHTLDQFLGFVADVRRGWKFERDDVGGPWYRGHTRKHWRLVPTVVRLGSLDLDTEDEIREEFVIRAPALSRFEPLPENEWDLYFLMQHYGAPTRLLDWTESPAIALYFAVRDNPGYYDSAVWMLDPYELNKRVIDKAVVISPSAQGASTKDSGRVSPWLPSRWSKRRIPDDPLAIFPTHIARRISSQKSCFTVHGRRERGFSRFAIGTKPCLKRVVIPGHVVQDVRLDLQNFGIDDTTIFPDLEGLGRTLAINYRDLAADSPHRGVYVRIRPSKLDRKGVGVFAIRNIPRGTRLFADENEELCWIPEKSLPKKGPLRKLYDDFAIIDDHRYGCPTSFNRLTPAWFMNESKKPNARCDENYDFYTVRDIAAGEELTIDYSTFSEYPRLPGR
jgi:hypothetical protein